MIAANTPFDWAHMWPYVGTGYVLAAGVLGGYTTWIVRKLRRTERSLPPADPGAER